MAITRRKYTLVTIKMEQMASNDDVELEYYMLILHFTNKYVLESVQHGHTSNIQFSLWKFAQSRARFVIFGQYRSSSLFPFYVFSY